MLMLECSVCVKVEYNHNCSPKDESAFDQKWECSHCPIITCRLEWHVGEQHAR